MVDGEVAVAGIHQPCLYYIIQVHLLPKFQKSELQAPRNNRLNNFILNNIGIPVLIQSIQQMMLLIPF